MAFSKSKMKESFSTEVTVFTPNDQCGHDESKFVAVFKRVPLRDYERLIDLPGREVLDEVLIGWKYFYEDDSEKKEVPFNPEEKAAMLDITEAVSGLTIAFWTAFNKQKTKNSKR